jgi:hypothetical protein
VDTPNKPQTSDEEAVQPAAAPSLQARSPYRPLSRRRRQNQPVEPESQVERPVTTMKFDASPATLAAALAKAGASPDEVTALTWGPGTKGQTEDDEDTDASS